MEFMPQMRKNHQWFCALIASGDQAAFGELRAHLRRNGEDAG
ncbi:hypothetical protein [uncultured Desulfovibrio sp.]|nr:hypothetical protein [uncultured Desulfovibrio sp.]